MKTTFKKLPIFLSLLFVILLFFLYSPTKNQSMAELICLDDYYISASSCPSTHTESIQYGSSKYYCCNTATKTCLKTTFNSCSSCNYGGYTKCQQTYYKCCRYLYKCGPYPCTPSMMQCPDCCCSSYTEPNCKGTKINDYCCDCPTTPTTTSPGVPTTTSPGGGNCSGSCSYDGKSGTCKVKASDGSGCSEGTFYATGECPGGSECICCVPNETHNCPNPSRCSDTYKYCRPSWTSTDPECGDTWNASYKIDCSCTEGTIDCSAKGVNTSSCNPTKPDCNEVDENDKNVECDPKCRTEIHTGDEIKCGDGHHTCDLTKYVDKTTGKETKDCNIVKYNDEEKNLKSLNCSKDCPTGLTCEKYSGKTYGECIQSSTTSWVGKCNETTGNCYEDSTGSEYIKKTDCDDSCDITTTTSTTTTTKGSLPTSTTTSSTTTTTKAVVTTLTFDLGLDGVGVSGDEPNPQDVNCTPQQILDGCGSNQNPLRKNRTLNVDLYNSNSTNVIQKSGTIKFDSTSGTFKGTVDLGKFTTGTYTIKVKSPGYLKRLVNDNQTITSGQTNNTVFKRMVTGNVNEDNLLNIEDYNIFLSCSEFGTDNKVACNSKSSYKTLSDLDDNGSINNYDYNLFMRELAVQQED